MIFISISRYIYEYIYLFLKNIYVPKFVDNLNDINRYYKEIV